MQTIMLNNNKYEVIKNYRNALNEKDIQNRFTDYFEPYDYVVGDIAYSSLRLKGFYDSKNKNAKKINNFDNLEEYLKKNCAVDCRYFILKKIIDKK